MSVPSPLDIDAPQIDLVVRRFYARVRLHPVLGPVFGTHVQDWPAHEAKVAAFWKGAILRMPGYEGSPMMAHRRAGNVKPEHFALWLGTFDAVLSETLEADAAAQWSALAHRIGGGLRQGVEDIGRAGGAVPRLR